MNLIKKLRIYVILINILFADYSQSGYGFSSQQSGFDKPNRIIVKQHGIISSEIDYNEYIVGPGDSFILDIVNLNLDYLIIMTKLMINIINMLEGKFIFNLLLLLHLLKLD